MVSKRAAGVISIDGVMKLKKENATFQCRYEFHDFGRSNSPRYTCTYILPNGSEEVLISMRFAEGGVQERLFALWPGLFKHHRQYGDGSQIVLHDDNRISTVTVDKKGKIKAITGPLANGETFTDSGDK